MVTLSVILPTYNRGFVIPNYIESLLNQSYSDWELIMIDDASTDNTIDVLSKYIDTDKRISLKRLEKHKGLPAARNVGVRSSNGQLICFGEDDITYCKKDSLSTLVETYFDLTDEFDVGAVGPRIVGDQGYRWINTVVQIGPISRNIYHNFNYVPSKMVEVPTLHSCSLVSKRAYMQVGGFEEKLYVGTYAKEEVDFYFRIKKKGFLIFFQPNATIFHHRASSGGCETKKRFRQYYYESRNTLLFIARFDGILHSYRFMTLPFLRRTFPNRIL